MKFRSDDQRKAIFANMNSSSSMMGLRSEAASNRFSADLFAKKSSLQLAAEDLNRGDLKSELINIQTTPAPLKLPEGTQAIFLVSDYGSYIKTKNAAREASDSFKGGSQNSDVVPIWDGNELKGHAVVSWTREGGGRNPRQYLPGASDVETVRQPNIDFIKREMESTPAEAPLTQPPISDRFKEFEAKLLTSGVPIEEAAKEAAFLKAFEGDDNEKKYLGDLIAAFDSSDEEDFYRFKKKFDNTYVGKKAVFSKKSKEDYFAVFQRGDDEYVCSFCGDVFSNRVTAAKHAGRCDNNSFNDKDSEYDEEDDFDSDDSAPDGFSV